MKDGKIPINEGSPRAAHSALGGTCFLCASAKNMPYMQIVCPLYCRHKHKTMRKGTKIDLLFFRNLVFLTPGPPAQTRQK